MIHLISDELSKELEEIFYEVFKIRFKFILGTSFFTYPDSESRLISYNIIYSGFSDKMYSSFVNKLCKKKLVEDEMDSMIVSILHEIGHIFTRYTFTKKEKTQYFKDQAELELIGTKQALLDYFNHPFELIATKFAVNYLLENRAVHVFLRDRIGNALSRFYILNDVTDENEEEFFSDLMDETEDDLEKSCSKLVGI